MARRRLRRPRTAHRVPDRLLNRRFVQMVTAHCPAARVTAAMGRRKYVLPTPLPAGVRIFSLQRARQPDLTESRFKITGMKVSDSHQLLLERHRERARKHRPAVLLPFAVPNDDD